MGKREPTQTCTVCHLDQPMCEFQSFQPGHGPVRQFRACREKKRANYHSKEKQQRSYAHKPLAMTERKCHDCPRITTDYRCPACLKAWREKENVSPGAYYSADNCIGGDIVGSGGRHIKGGTS